MKKPSPHKPRFKFHSNQHRVHQLSIEVKQLLGTNLAIKEDKDFPATFSHQKRLLLDTFRWKNIFVKSKKHIKRWQTVRIFFFVDTLRRILIKMKNKIIKKSDHVNRGDVGRWRHRKLNSRELVAYHANGINRAQWVSIPTFAFASWKHVAWMTSFANSPHHRSRLNCVVFPIIWLWNISSHQ